MVEGKPYRYGLIVAGLCMIAVGLFIMTQERPHIYGTMCVLGVGMVCVGTAWSFCQCYPKVILAPGSHERYLQEIVDTAAGTKDQRPPDALPSLCGKNWSSSSSRLVPQTSKSQSQSCPTLHLI